MFQFADVVLKFDGIDIGSCREHCAGVVFHERRMMGCLPFFIVILRTRSVRDQSFVFGRNP